MTRKDYILIAEALRERHYCVREDITLGASEQAFRLAEVNRTSERIAYALESDNPRFDREHFLAVVRGEKELNSRPTRR